MTTKTILNVPTKKLPIKPLTRQELADAAKARVSLIDKEFSNGFDFIAKYPKSVTIFGSTRLAPESTYYNQAYTVANRIALELGYAVFTGGGPGTMEAANHGAFDAGGKSLGLTIELPEHQVSNPYLTDHLDFYYFFSRKVSLSFCAEAYVFFPGGFGTLDEFFEILTLVQTHKIERVPIILVGSDYWNKLDEFLKHEVLARGMIENDDIELYTITDDSDKIIDIIRTAPVRNGIRFEYKAE
ncbi:MAG: hypothetical protein QG589_51 [Patescibacteria group bacterium]|nr:hypothetical protein [Patescibacteria group bacterium]